MRKAWSSWWFLAPAAILVWGWIAISGVDYVGKGSWWFARMLAPQPYKDVYLIEQRREGPWLYTTSTFIKTDGCAKLEFRVVGDALGVQYPLEWADLDGRDLDENRIAGRHTLRGRIFVLSQDFDWIEMRTRHDCGGIVVDRVYATLYPGDVITKDTARSVNDGYVGPKGGYR